MRGWRKKAIAAGSEKLQETNELHRLRESILRLEESVQNLRRDIGFAAYILLVHTKSMPEAEAKEWIRKNMVNRD